ncbi:hypothetical protein ACTQ2S_04900 [Parolsenella catena]|uniref:hypothetical protein n=1 Tax=Parolsenella catena TaxID=2003188 RepID=UPI003F99859F
MNVLSKAVCKAKKTIRRYRNQMHRWEYPPSAGCITVHPDPIVGGGSDGTCFDPFVMPSSSGYTLFMSRRATESVVRVDSRDGVSWGQTVEVLGPNSQSGSWDSAVNRACVLTEERGWTMWYTGQHEGRSCIGIARSDDGFRFERAQGDPVIEAELPFEGMSVMNPDVVRETDGTYRMWYAAGEDYEPDVICEARSADGIHWAKRKEPVLARGVADYDCYKVGGCHVLRLSSRRLAMFYIGYQNLDVARVCLALSDDDGASWKRSILNPLISPEHGSWRSDAVYKPTALIDENGNLRIWFNARSKRTELVGLAEARACEVLGFE